MSSADRIKQARQDLFETLVADMERDGARWCRSWSFDAPRNPETGTVYRGRNALLLTFYMRAKGLDDPRFMTFNQAKGRGLKVAKGSRSYPIEKWKRIAYRSDDPKARVRQPRTPEEWEAVEVDPNMAVALKPVGAWSLFNAADIEGIEPYERRGGIVGEAEAVDFLIDNSPCKVNELAGPAAFYSPSSDQITVPSRSQFAQEAAMARVLLHEQGHATGAESRLGRDMGDGFGSEGYAREELVAELSSLFTANELGVRFPAIEPGDAFAESDYWRNHVAYLKSWSSMFEDPAAELMQAASRAGAASDWLMGNCFDAPERTRRAEPEHRLSRLREEGGRCEAAAARMAGTQHDGRQNQEKGR